MAVKSTFKNMTLCLFCVCIVSSALLAGVYALTKAPIAAAAQKKTNDAIAAVLPEFEGTPEEASVEVAGKNYSYYKVSKGGKVVAYAIKSSSVGFGGPVSLMVGVTAKGIVYNTSVLSQSETPGLGAKCTDPSFAAQFKEFDPFKNKLSVTKDGGSIQAITASTITSRAYCAAVQTALDVFAEITK